VKHHTPAEACLNLLDKLNFYKDFEVGEDNRIQRLYFTDPKLIELAKTHSDILMFDCTYQTNKYGLPLLNIIGASSLHKTTQIGLAFLSGEVEHDFDWVMCVLRRMFEVHQIRLPRIIVTDRQLALINELEIHIPESNYVPSLSLAFQQMCFDKSKDDDPQAGEK
jgi:MULE transposase domain